MTTATEFFNQVESIKNTLIANGYHLDNITVASWATQSGVEIDILDYAVIVD
jgi:hypothetical protein